MHFLHVSTKGKLSLWLLESSSRQGSPALAAPSVKNQVHPNHQASNHPRPANTGQTVRKGKATSGLSLTNLRVAEAPTGKASHHKKFPP